MRLRALHSAVVRGTPPFQDERASTRTAARVSKTPRAFRAGAPTEEKNAVRYGTSGDGAALPTPPFRRPFFLSFFHLRCLTSAYAVPVPKSALPLLSDLLFLLDDCRLPLTPHGPYVVHVCSWRLITPRICSVFPYD